MTKIYAALAATLLLAGGSWLLINQSSEAPAHAHGDGDEHEHGEHGHEHSEEGEHAHGDADEHAEEGHDHEHAEQAEQADEGEEDGHEGGGHAEEGQISIRAENAEKAGIVVEEAGPASIQSSVALSGRILLNQTTTAYVEARFPGIVRSASKAVGDTVKQGEVLATVESNDSLQTYSVTSPLTGTVIERSTNIGAVAGDAPLFVVSDLSKIWAEFHVFPKDISRVRTGQTILVEDLEGTTQAQAIITALLPVAESATQTLVARAELDNVGSVWRSGMTVQGHAVTETRDVAMAVKNDAVQRIKDAPVVFVQNEEGFQVRQVTLGLKDHERTEVVDGLAPGDRYAVKNSFLLKAELGKAEAEHEH